MFRIAALSRLAFLCTFTFALGAATFAPPHMRAQEKQLKDDAAAKSTAREPKDNDKPLPKDAIRNPVLWHQPANIASLDMFYGQGGKDRMPVGPFTFVDEDKNGTNPKMDVRDANGKKWRVKEGEEARPEVVASRLLWAVGYYANDDYLVHQATVSGVNVKRGSKEFKAGNLADVRFSKKPSGENKIGIWQWKDNPFYGTKEFNGLA